MKWDAKTSQSQREAAARYDADMTTRVSLKLNNKTDADILVYLDSVKGKPGGMQGLIKRLLREEMQREQKGE